MRLVKKWMDLSIRMKFFIGFLTIVLLSSISMMILNAQLLHVVKNNEVIVNGYIPKLSKELEVKNKIGEQINDLLLYITTNNKEYKANFYQSITQAKVLNQGLLNEATLEEKPAIEQIIFTTEKWEFYISTQVLPVYDDGNKEEAIQVLNSTAISIAETLMNQVDDLSNRKRSDISNLYTRIMNHAWSSVTIGFIIIGTTMLFAILFSFYASRNMTNPIVEELKEANEKLREESERAKESTRLKSEFLANISHELRTPLTAIIGYAELMGGMGKDFSRQIVGAAEHLLTMINDILDLSKIEAGKYELEWERFDLRNTIVSAINLLRSRAEKRKIQLVFHWPEEPFLLEADEKRIRQVLLNLIVNAIKFSNDGGSVRIKLWRDVDHLSFSVQDFGIGIEKEKQNKIFEQFYQNDGSLGRKYEGTGLGLTLSKQLIELHKGTIEVDSELGQGSEFTVTLPIAKGGIESVLPAEEKRKYTLYYFKECEKILPEILAFFAAHKMEIAQQIPFTSDSDFQIRATGLKNEKYDIIFAGQIFQPEYLSALREIKKAANGKTIAYVHESLRLPEKGQIMGVADEVYIGKG